MKVLSVVGARPQFVKVAMVRYALSQAGINERIVHTGQHYDDNMSKVFFEEMGIPMPMANLEVGSGSHAYQTGEAMMRLEKVCLEYLPDIVIVHGDTNATLAGALVATKLKIPIGHVEAGLRSFDLNMPEEINRVAVDHVSKWLFCPTETAVGNLAAEGIKDGVHNVGDVMYDAALHFGKIARERSRILENLGLCEREYVLATIHRDFNADSSTCLTGIIEGLVECGERIIFPAHPRVRRNMEKQGLMEMIEGASQMSVIDFYGLPHFEDHDFSILADASCL